MKKTLREWLIFLVLLLDEAAAAGLVLLVLWLLKVRIPLAGWIALAVVVGIIAFIFQRLVIPSFYLRRVTGREGMVGLRGEVVEPLAPEGLVRVKGECWKARSFNGNIPAGKKVEVTGVDGLVLKVKPKD